MKIKYSNEDHYYTVLFIHLYVFYRAIFCNKKVSVQLSNDMTPHNERQRIMIQVSILFRKILFY